MAGQTPGQWPGTADGGAAFFLLLYPGRRTEIQTKRIGTERRARTPRTTAAHTGRHAATSTARRQSETRGARAARATRTWRDPRRPAFRRTSTTMTSLLARNLITHAPHSDVHAACLRRRRAHTPWRAEGWRCSAAQGSWLNWRLATTSHVTANCYERTPCDDRARSHVPPRRSAALRPCVPGSSTILFE